MNLEQFNVDLEGGLKKKIRVEAVENDCTHGVMMTAIVEDFYRRHTSKVARQKLFARMKAKVERGEELESAEPKAESKSIDEVEFADASTRA